MPQTCRICAHSKTKEIERDIIQGIAHTAIAEKYGVNSHSVRYHAEHHLSGELVEAFQRNRNGHTDDILSGIKELLVRTKAIFDEADQKGQKRLALDAIRESRSTYELLSKIAVKLEEYRRQDLQTDEALIEQQLAEGMKALSDDELETLVQLTAKIYAADPDYVLNATSRRVVESMRILKPEPVLVSDDKDACYDQNSLKTSGDELDLDLDNIKLDETDLFEDDESLEEPEPEWLIKDRKRNYYR